MPTYQANRLPRSDPLLISALVVLLLTFVWGYGSESNERWTNPAYAKESAEPQEPMGPFLTGAPPAPPSQTAARAQEQSTGCVSCHTATDQPTMHRNRAVLLGCSDCHGGDPSVQRPEDAERYGPGTTAYAAALARAHVQPRHPMSWKEDSHLTDSKKDGPQSAANPQISFTALNKESPAFVRFINPSDYRVARDACGACHLPLIQAAERSLMATSAMFWNGAAYNNGIVRGKFADKRGIFGEAYTPLGIGAVVNAPIVPDEFMTSKGILETLFPLPAWETVPPSDVFRVFEDGGRVINSQFPEVGLPNIVGRLQTLDEPGRPDIRQSNRGPGTGARIAVPVINLTKTRLNDPHMWFLGTNDQPGDYRSSGCAGCHVVYANDRDPRHSGPYWKYGHAGTTVTNDPTIPRDKSGHPLQHEFTRSIPSSQCMVCHMHQPNVFVNSFYGYTMWDYEVDAPYMWPKQQRYPTDQERREILNRNPEGAAMIGKWSDPGFLRDVWVRNTENIVDRRTQFADYHGHGWNFRAVYKRDRKGTLLDKDGNPVDDADPEKFNKAVHLSSIHLDKGMHCVDCHFSQDVHGNGHIYGEVAAAIEIDCSDCHGTVDRYPTLFTSGPAAPRAGTDLGLLRVPDGRKRFEWVGGKLYQRSALDPGREWEMPLVKDSMNPKHKRYNKKAERAKLMSKGGSDAYGMSWGSGVKVQDRAHGDDKMTCYSCHLSWTTSCSGCHLPIEANWKSERNHYEGGETRNYATYNPQVVRDDIFQLGIHSSVKGNKIAPIRSSSALVLSSTNANRERIYIQQAPVSSSGFSSQAFAPHYPHTERKTETKTCSDCHVAEKNDNNAIMAQLLLHGTNFVNFIGFNAWVGEERHIEAVQVTEWEEPQAVIGSYLHKYAYPDWHKAHEKRGYRLPEAHEHGTGGQANCLQLRGEYLYVAEGAGGMRVYDVASIANKGVSQRIVTAPFSPIGQNTHISSKNATCVALPTNQPIDPTRNQGDLMRKTNQEQEFHALYNYALIVDAEEGLILTNVNTLHDFEPRNNFLKRALTWNEDGVLKGARHITIGGYYAYIAADAGLVVVNLKEPMRPRVAAIVPVAGVTSSALQFRYLFVTRAGGLSVIDVTRPEAARVVGKGIELGKAHRVFVARTYAYVAAGDQGLAIIDIEYPEAPILGRFFNAAGRIKDARDVTVGSTNASLFAYVADGEHGLKVLQLTNPKTQPKFYGYSPTPNPELIAWRPTRSPAIALSKGLERDRAVDETGGQVAVFGRIGSRPFNYEEQRKLYLKQGGELWRVNDDIDMSKYKK